jgi:O-methyltransferase involved in polyketide biosynthesis
VKNSSVSPIDSTALSSTALYTAYVWQRNHLASVNLARLKGFLYYQLLRPINGLARSIKGIDLETILLQRHKIIDALLTEEIKSGRVKQVVELAAGFSPRGSNFVSRFGLSHDLIYIFYHFINFSIHATYHTCKMLINAVKIFND